MAHIAGQYETGLSADGTRFASREELNARVAEAAAVAAAAAAVAAVAAVAVVAIAAAAVAVVVVDVVVVAAVVVAFVVVSPVSLCLRVRVCLLDCQSVCVCECAFVSIAHVTASCVLFC